MTLHPGRPDILWKHQHPPDLTIPPQSGSDGKWTWRRAPQGYAIEVARAHAQLQYVTRDHAKFPISRRQNRRLCAGASNLGRHTRGMQYCAPRGAAQAIVKPTEKPPSNVVKMMNLRSIRSAGAPRNSFAIFA